MPIPLLMSLIDRTCMYWLRFVKCIDARDAYILVIHRMLNKDK